MESGKQKRTFGQWARDRKTFLIVLCSSIAFSAALAGLLYYVNFITYDITIQIDNKVAPCQTRSKTVGAVLKEVGFKVEEYDIVEPGLKKHLRDDLTVEVKQVDKVEEQAEETTPFKTVKEDDPELNKGTTEVTRKGKKGKDLVTYLVTYTSGKETAREEIDRETIKKPVDKIVHVGIREHIDGFAYTRKEVFQATAYSGGGRTATGTRARVGEIAVDPRVIPLGTTVYVEGFGPLRAEDTGGAIKGHIIDIYMSSNAACRRWGRRNVTVYLP